MSDRIGTRWALRRGARAGVIAAAAAAGALLGFGLRGGMAARPFNAMAALLLGNRARGVWGFDVTTSTVGLCVLVLTCVAAGTALGALVGARAARARGSWPRLAAFVVAFITAASAVALLASRAPDVVGPAPVGALSLAQGVVLAIVAAAGFASGMGLAR